ncbi:MULTISPECIES: hypothetical protein [Bacillus cereus group]
MRNIHDITAVVSDTYFFRNKFVIELYNEDDFSFS